jgi:hypothetical protein
MRYEHQHIAKKALGRRLKSPEEVHHIDKDQSNNDPANLVICPDHTYHMLLHIRQDAFEACGNYDYRKCEICKQYDDLKNLKVYKRTTGTSTNLVRIVHTACNRRYAYSYRNGS